MVPNIHTCQYEDRGHEWIPRGSTDTLLQLQNGGMPFFLPSENIYQKKQELAIIQETQSRKL